MAYNYDINFTRGDTIRWTQFFKKSDGSTYNFSGSTVYMNVRTAYSSGNTVASYQNYISGNTASQPQGYTGGINGVSGGTFYICIGSTYTNNMKTEKTGTYEIKAKFPTYNDIVTLLKGNIYPSQNVTPDYTSLVGPTAFENFILLFDSYPGGNYWSDYQNYNLGSSFDGEYYKYNSSFYEYGTAPAGYSTTGQNSGWRRKIPESYYTYKTRPKPTIFVNVGTYTLYPNVFISSNITTSFTNSVPLPAGYTQGYYYQASSYPAFVLLNSNVSGLTASSLVSYAPSGITNYSNFDGTGRGVTTFNLYGMTALYYVGLTGPAPSGGEGITGFDSSTVWPQRNQANLIPVHDIVGIILQIISSVRAFYKNNPEYPEPNYDFDETIDHYVALSFGYSAVISSVVDALDLYTNLAPNIINSDRITYGYNSFFVNRYDAICSISEINRILKYLKTLNDGSTRNTEIKNKVKDLIKIYVLPYYNNDSYSQNEYAILEKILNNIEKLKVSFYNTVIGPIHPAYLNTCNTGYLDVYSAIGSGVTCGSSTINGGAFYSHTYYSNGGITYPFFTYGSSTVIPIYTVQGITLDLNVPDALVVQPYKLRAGTQNFDTYAEILNSKFGRSFTLANSTNGMLKYVDWVYFLTEDFEVYSNDDERASWNYFFAKYAKYVRDYYRDSTVPLISMQTKQTVISSGDTESLASNGFVFLEPGLNFRRTVKPIIDAGLDGIGTYATYDVYLRSLTIQLENMGYNYALNQDPGYSTGTRFSVNTELAQYYGRSVTVGGYNAPPSCDIKKYITGIADSNSAVASVSPASGATYSQICSVGDTAGDWSTHFAHYRGVAFNSYIQSLMGNCYQHINTTSGRYQNWFSRKEEVQKIIDINTDWAKAYYENALLYKYNSIT